MSAMIVVEKCACGASIDLSGDSIHVPFALREWRAKHQHEKPLPRRTVILGSRQPRIRAWSYRSHRRRVPLDLMPRWGFTPLDS